METVLEFENVTKRFPGLVANDQVSFDVRRGEVHALVGENGAGKSTLVNMIAGLYRQDEGEIRLWGEPVSNGGPRGAIAQGVGMVHQHFMLIHRFNVVQNVILGFEESCSRFGCLDLRQAREMVEELCRCYDFRLNLSVPVGTLSVGQQQRVEILKSLYRGANLLILDEPTAVLTLQEVRALFENLRRLTAQGKTVIFISHKLDEVLNIADRVTVLRRGRVIATVNAMATDKKQLAEMMVGRPVLFQLDKPVSRPGETVLEMDQVVQGTDAGHHKLNRLTLTVRRGEIYGIAGVEGNGQRELVETIMGLMPYDSGDIKIQGRSNRGRSVRDIRAGGVAYIPDDRQQRGLSLAMTVWENAVLGLVRSDRYSRWWKLCTDRIRDFAARKVREFDIRLSSVELPIRSLSGGNQQKVILAREMSVDPELIIAAQPVRGLDIGAIEFVHRQLIAARTAGKAVLLVSADLEEVLSVADRVGILYNGAIVKEFIPGELETETIGEYMLGAGKEAAVWTES
ncbi:MAG TPA: ABC transporter ATP-binding protein [Patescibacteria group bacterium]|nr:ABC transporter ATP-binding protein [Patescibacteria group bacterium]